MAIAFKIYGEFNGYLPPVEEGNFKRTYGKLLIGFCGGTVEAQTTLNQEAFGEFEEGDFVVFEGLLLKDQRRRYLKIKSLQKSKRVRSRAFAQEECVAKFYEDKTGVTRVAFEGCSDSFTLPKEADVSSIVADGLYIVTLGLSNFVRTVKSNNDDTEWRFDQLAVTVEKWDRVEPKPAPARKDNV